MSNYNYVSTYTCKKCKIKFKFDYNGNPIRYSEEFCGAFATDFIKGNNMKKRPCLLCKKLLEPALESWDTNQPHGGGEIQLIFSYGSCKFDNNVGATTFKALICDECAEGLVGDMEEGSYGD